MFASPLFGYLADYLLWWALFLSILLHTWCFFKFFPRQRRRKVGLALGNALVSLCMLGVVGLGAETYLRYLAVETDAFGMSLAARRWFALHTQLNSMGCRDKEWTVEKPPGRRRIAVVGDSFVYGWGIERVEDRFSDALQAYFDQRSAARVEVMNVAKPGWDTGAQRVPIQDLIDRYSLDEVLLGYVPNDIEKLLPRSPEFDPIQPPKPEWINLSTSCLIDHLYRRIWLPHVPTVSTYHNWLAEGFGDETIWRKHQQQLGAIMAYCNDHHVKLRVVLLPFIRISGEKYNAPRLHDTLRRFFDTNGVAVVDLLPTITGKAPETLVVNPRDAHPNEATHKLFADAIWKAFYESSDQD